MTTSYVHGIFLWHVLEGWASCSIEPKDFADVPRASPLVCDVKGLGKQLGNRMLEVPVSDSRASRKGKKSEYEDWWVQ